MVSISTAIYITARGYSRCNHGAIKITSALCTWHEEEVRKRLYLVECWRISFFHRHCRRMRLSLLWHHCSRH